MASSRDVGTGPAEETERERGSQEKERKLAKALEEKKRRRREPARSDYPSLYRVVGALPFLGGNDHRRFSTACKRTLMKANFPSVQSRGGLFLDATREKGRTKYKTPSGRTALGVTRVAGIHKISTVCFLVLKMHSGTLCFYLYSTPKCLPKKEDPSPRSLSVLAQTTLRRVHFFLMHGLTCLSVESKIPLSRTKKKQSARQDNAGEAARVVVRNESRSSSAFSSSPLSSY